jgi:flagellar protein FlaG
MNIAGSRLDIYRPDKAVSTENTHPESKTVAADVQQAVHTVNQSQFFGEKNVLTFQVDPGTRKAVTRVVDRESGEILRQIPAQYILRLAQDLAGKKSHP